MSEERFYRLTPKQLSVLVKRKREVNEYRQEQLELIAGIVSQTIANYAGRIRKNADAVPGDFMPSYQARKAKAEAKKPDAARIREFLAQHFTIVKAEKADGS